MYILRNNRYSYIFTSEESAIAVLKEKGFHQTGILYRTLSTNTLWAFEKMELPKRHQNNARIVGKIFRRKEDHAHYWLEKVDIDPANI